MFHTSKGLRQLQWLYGISYLCLFIYSHIYIYICIICICINVHIYIYYIYTITYTYIDTVHILIRTCRYMLYTYCFTHVNIYCMHIHIYIYIHILHSLNFTHTTWTKMWKTANLRGPRRGVHVSGASRRLQPAETRKIPRTFINIDPPDKAKCDILYDVFFG